MANKTRLRIVTPTGELYNDEAEMVIMRTSVGDIGVLAGHQPLTTTLGYGVLKITNGESETRATVFGGFVSVTPTEVVLLTDAAEWVDDIDLERAQAAKERAEQRIQSGESDIDVVRAELSLRRALIRLDSKKK